MGCGTSFVKYVLFFFNLIVALLGLVMVGIGIAVLMNWVPISNLLTNLLYVAPWLFIVVGAVMFVIAFFGCCGAIMESHCMVVTYAIFLIVIIITQVVLAVLMFTYSENIKNTLLSTVHRGFTDCVTNAASQETFNSLQRQLSCCGYDGPQDYTITPESCCPLEAGFLGSAIKPINGSSCTIIEAYPGCKTVIGDLYDKWNHTIAGVAIGVACIEVIGALFALCLANSIRNMDRRLPRSPPSPDLYLPYSGTNMCAGWPDVIAV